MFLIHFKQPIVEAAQPDSADNDPAQAVENGIVQVPVNSNDANENGNEHVLSNNLESLNGNKDSQDHGTNSAEQANETIDSQFAAQVN